MSEYQPLEAVCRWHNKVWRDEWSTTNMASTVMQANLPRPLANLRGAAPYDPGSTLLFATVWKKENLLILNEKRIIHLLVYVMSH